MVLVFTSQVLGLEGHNSCVIARNIIIYKFNQCLSELRDHSMAHGVVTGDFKFAVDQAAHHEMFTKEIHVHVITIPV